MMKKRILAGALALLTLLMILSGCTEYQTNKEKVLSAKDAKTELEAFCKEIDTDTITPKMDIYDDSKTSQTLADIDTFEITQKGQGDINIEIAAPSEISGSAPDDWLNVVAEKFNKSGKTVNGKSVSVSVRKISSGEVYTYMTEGNYKPDVYIPSSNAMGEMVKAKGIKTIKLSDRILGNTAGILMEKNTYDSFKKKHKKVTLTGVLDACLNGEFMFAYTNPYTSATGLNILSSMLYSFDSKNPLSEKAQSKLLNYQKKSPPVAYTTGVLKNQAAKGIIKAMVMEEQAYLNTPELRDYVYTPAGIRHDHPVYTFGYVSKAKQQAAKLFTDYCLNKENQDLGTEKGFNKNNKYKSQDIGFSGVDYIAAQKIWKQNKDGGQPVIAMFVADVSGSMTGTRINSLKSSLISTAQYISSDNYVGLISYNDDVHINLELNKFDAEQKAYFTGAVKSLQTDGGTATYNAMLIALKKLLDKKKEVPNAKMMLFVLSDGEQNVGYSLDRVVPIVGGLKVPVYTIAYEISNDSAKKELNRLSDVNEAAFINSSSDNIVNELRSLFNTQL